MNVLKNYRSSLVGISVVALLTLVSSVHATPVLSISQTNAESVYTGPFASDLRQDFTTGGQASLLTTVSVRITDPGWFFATGEMMLYAGAHGGGGSLTTYKTATVSEDTLGQYWLTANFNNYLLSSSTTYDLEFWANGGAYNFYVTTTPDTVSTLGATSGNLYEWTSWTTGTLIPGYTATFETPGAVPEPNAMTMLLLGGILIGGYAKLKQRSAQAVS